ncbi:hypothetical protein [Glacieibacterium frigidum]|uniref:Uncharacterized protein n=1 Tax=Glacieibacterium frigidum TaxID=2593303 RepID=A0A552U7X1_9SPHN|nr:hypothetical protein [Glacieibacterium frigidum]TRW14269.1 hypothetical protein FMM06_11165 [Glacieibacterium frigidum]
MSTSNITISAGRDAVLSAVAIGDGARAMVAIGTPAQFAEAFTALRGGIEELAVKGQLSPVQRTELLTAVAETETSVAAPAAIDADRATKSLTTLAAKFRAFCSDQQTSGVFACLQSLAALIGLPVALVT